MYTKSDFEYMEEKDDKNKKEKKEFCEAWFGKEINDNELDERYNEIKQLYQSIEYEHYATNNTNSKNTSQSEIEGNNFYK